MTLTKEEEREIGWVVIRINGENPFKGVPVEGEPEYYQRNRTFKLAAVCNEHCTKDKNFIVFENTATKEKLRFLVEFLD